MIIFTTYVILYTDLGDDIETNLHTLLAGELRARGLHQPGYQPEDAPDIWANKPVTRSFAERLQDKNASLPLGAFPVYEDSDINVETGWDDWPKLDKSGIRTYEPHGFFRTIKRQEGRSIKMFLRYLFSLIRYAIRFPLLLLFNLSKELPHRQYASQYWNLTSPKDGARPIGVIMAFPSQCLCRPCAEIWADYSSPRSPLRGLFRAEKGTTTEAEEESRNIS